MASSSPAAPGLTVEAVQNEELATLRSDSAVERAPPPSQGVHDHDVASVKTLPSASDEENALAAGESVKRIFTIVRYELAFMMQVAPY
jgi:hypothetical protein